MPAFLNPESVIDGKPLNVGSLLADAYLIRDYQRDYVWKKGTVEPRSLVLPRRRSVGIRTRFTPQRHFMPMLTGSAANHVENLLCEIRAAARRVQRPSSSLGEEVDVECKGEVDPAR
jgi:hypothetical protein